MARTAQEHIFIYRTENLHDRALSNDSIQILEQSRRRWRVREGDVLVFTEGGGLGLRFISYSRVRRAETIPSKEGTELVTVRVTADPPEQLPSGLFLNRLMYSLTGVANFGRPWLHLRHRVRLTPRDLETLQEARIEWDRTVFFGLLRELPADWRAFLEHESRAARARKDIGSYSYRSSAQTSYPARELLTLLESLLIAPSKLAGEIEKDWSEVLGSRTLSELEVVEPGGEAMRWNIVPLFRGSAARHDQLMSAWNEVRDLKIIERDPREELGWRPHRW